MKYYDQLDIFRKKDVSFICFFKKKKKALKTQPTWFNQLFASSTQPFFPLSEVAGKWALKWLRERASLRLQIRQKYPQPHIFFFTLRYTQSSLFIFYLKCQRRLGVGFWIGDWQTTLLGWHNKSPPCGRVIHTACACHQQPMGLGREPPTGLGTNTTCIFSSGKRLLRENRWDIHTLWGHKGKSSIEWGRHPHTELLQVITNTAQGQGAL